MDERLKNISDPSCIIPADGCEDIYFKLLNSMYDGIGLFEFANGKIRALYLNERYFQVIGFTREQYLPYLDNVTVTLFEDDEARLIENVRRTCGSDSLFSAEVRGYRGDNSVAWFCLRGRYVNYIRSNNAVMIVSIYDCTHSKELEHKLKLNKERYRILEETCTGYLFEYDPEKDLISFSAAQDSDDNHISSYSSYLKKTGRIHPDDAAYFYCTLLRACRKACGGTVDIRWRGDGMDSYMLCKITYSGVSDDYDSVIRVVGRIEIISDRADSAPRIINRIPAIPGMDFLPDACNCLDEIGLRLAGRPKNMYLILIDIDGLDAVNSLCGYEDGTNMLIRFARLMVKIFEGDVVFRFTPEIFAVYAEDLTEKELYYRIDEMKKTEGVFFSAGAARQVNVKENVGLRDYFITAAAALYKAKKEGGSRVHSELIVAG